MSQWQPIEDANEQVRELARVAAKWWKPGQSRLLVGHGFEMGPPMSIPSYLFWIEDDHTVRRFFAVPPID